MAVFHQLRFLGHLHPNHFGDNVGACASLKTSWIRRLGLKPRTLPWDKFPLCVLFMLRLVNQCPLETWVLVSALPIHLL